VEDAVRLSRWQWAGVALACVAVVAGKQFYRDASPGELQWLLAPVARLVSLVTHTPFSYDPAQGWISRDAMFVIAPACAGLNFALAAFLALAIAWLPKMQSARAVLGRLAGAALVAYVATLFVDTVRIALTIVSGARGDAHQALGVAVYLGALCALYALARGKDHHAVSA
jgi:exosortase K